jgi:hypothetical protein
MNLIIEKKFITQEEISFFNGSNMPWYLQNNVSSTNLIGTEYDGQWLAHTVVRRYDNPGEEMKIESGIYEYIKDILDRFCAMHNIKYERILRMSINLTIHTGHKYAAAAHVDHTYPHKLCFIYFNDAEGPTVLFKETWDDHMETEVEFDRVTENTKILPEEGKVVVLLEGNTYHSNIPPSPGQMRNVGVITFL